MPTPNGRSSPDQQWSAVQEEDEQNGTLLDLSERILTLTEEVRDLAAPPRSVGHDQEDERTTDRPRE